jgi:catechol 2,3-dioxygenase-like lactoylglutathione lyase family enzyme
MRPLTTALLLLTTAAHAQLPDFYKRVNRVTWLVKSLDPPAKGWSQFGLSNIHEHNLTFVGEYRGKAITIQARSITGSIGNFTIDMLQPAAGENAFSDFLAHHGDGIFSIVHEVSSMEEMTKEIDRMRTLGVHVLQQLTVKDQFTITYFDTEPQGKYVLGLIYWPNGSPPNNGLPGKISHIGFVARDAEGPSAFWQKLGFPAMPKSHASPREDSRYHSKPLWLDFDVCWQRHTQFTYEWIIPPATPPNLYVDYLNTHGEGIQHLGVPVDDLDKSIADYQKLGYSVAQSGAWGDLPKKGSGRYAYLDTDSIGGVIAEIIHPN